MYNTRSAFAPPHRSLPACAAGYAGSRAAKREGSSAAKPASKIATDCNTLETNTFQGETLCFKIET